MSYLENAWQDYCALPGDQAEARLTLLSQLAAAYDDEGHTDRANELRSQFAAGLNQPLTLFDLSCGLEELARRTANPDDLRYAESRSKAIDDEVTATSVIFHIVNGWLRLGFRAEAERALVEGIERFPDLPDFSPEYSAVLARMGRLDEALAAVERQPEYRREGCQREITRICLSLGDKASARRLYHECWDRYRETRIGQDGRAEKSIAWNSDDCRNLIALDELALLGEALPYVEGFVDPHPIDFWLEFAQAWWSRGDRTSARGIMSGFLGLTRNVDDLQQQARKRLLLASMFRRLGFPWRAARLVAVASASLEKIKQRDQRFFLYEALIRYHLDHGELRPAQHLCRQARLWMVGKTPTEKSENLKGLLESGLVSLYGKAGLIGELDEVTATLNGVVGKNFHLAFAEASLNALRLDGSVESLRRAEQSIAAEPDPRWRVELWLTLQRACRERSERDTQAPKSR